MTAELKTLMEDRVNAKMQELADAFRYRPADITLPDGWTWELVEAERARWGIDETMVPVAIVPGACVAWGTINSVRKAMVS